MKDYHYDYITLKARHERMKLTHDAKIEKLNREIAELRAKIIQPIVMPKFDLDLGDILNIVSRVTQVFQEDIISSKRHREIVTARALFCYICRNHLKKPFAHIGRFINRDHSTIIHLVNNYESYLEMQYEPETNYYNESINRVNYAKRQGIFTHNLGDGEGSNLLCEEIPESRMASV
jgi:chromosomal replication initiation ATPase DnaA